jgi:hypothetical protein
MSEPTIIDGWTCTVREYSRRAQKGSDSFELFDDELTVEDTTRYYPGGAYSLTPAVLTWLLADRDADQFTAGRASLEAEIRAIFEPLRGLHKACLPVALQGALPKLLALLDGQAGGEAAAAPFCVGCSGTGVIPFPPPTRGMRQCEACGGTGNPIGERGQ